jgi:two-component system, cell cycle sensor histidine kinase and response regulator CckA
LTEASRPIEVLAALAAGIAHEFNEDLTVILSSLSHALEDVRPEHPAYEHLRELQRAARRCAETARCLTAFSVRVNPETRPFHLGSFFAAAERVLPN